MFTTTDKPTMTAEQADLLARIIIAWGQHITTMRAQHPRWRPTISGFALWLVLESGFIKVEQA